MRAAAIAVVGFGVLLAALAAFAPATLVDRRVAAATAGKLRLADAAGTIWRGTGTLTDAGNTWRMPVAWRTSATGLASGRLQIGLAPAGGAASPRGTLDLRVGGGELRDLAVDIPAAALAALLPSRSNVALGGTVALASPDFGWAGERGTGVLNARWREARLFAGGALADLGTVDVSLSAQEQRLTGRIGNSGGDVHIDGSFNVADGVVSVDATVAPAPAAPPQIARALAALGTPDGNGAVRVAWRGALR
ncbi:MAG: type II secretion system protein N [Betaproteobacteria bacterium]